MIHYLSTHQTVANGLLIALFGSLFLAALGTLGYVLYAVVKAENDKIEEFEKHIQ